MNLKWILYLLSCVLLIGFFACKRSISSQSKREYEPKLVAELQKLEQKYAGKKVRINTWDKQNDAYTDIQVTDENKQLSRTLTIGDSVELINIDLSKSDGIRAIIKIQDTVTCLIPYSKIEEFEPAIKYDPDI